ncbi:hypothetical protein BH23BAC1_BH23BAC1_19190 [soil metagenome]
MDQPINLLDCHILKYHEAWNDGTLLRYGQLKAIYIN